LVDQIASGLLGCILEKKFLSFAYSKGFVLDLALGKTSKTVKIEQEASRVVQATEGLARADGRSSEGSMR
jgi:hypothetical protein